MSALWGRVHDFSSDLFLKWRLSIHPWKCILVVRVPGNDVRCSGIPDGRGFPQAAIDAVAARNKFLSFVGCNEKHHDSDTNDFLPCP